MHGGTATVRMATEIVPPSASPPRLLNDILAGR